MTGDAAWVAGATPVWRLTCTDCGMSLDPREAEYLCPRCGVPTPGSSPRGVLRADFEALDEPAAFPDAARPGMARWAALLPLPSADLLPPLPVGPSPLVPAVRLGAEAGLERLWIKDDTGLPTGSHKDRASALVVAKALELRRTTVTTASTGNAAVALAAMCASAGIRAVIFVPATAPPAKLAQMLAFGATVVPVRGTYDHAYALSLDATRAFGWYNRSTAYNPYTIEGKKTAAFEIWEQMGRTVPDAVVVPVGDGVILAGVHKGFGDLVAHGLADRMPRLVAVQAEGSSAIAAALDLPGDDVPSIGRATTVADSISVATPAAGRWAKRAVRETRGAAVVVADDEILAAIATLGRTTGIFAEPAAAAAVAGLRKGVAAGALHHGERVVVLVTGTGLKDVDAVRRVVTLPEPIEPNIGAVVKRLGSRGEGP